MSSIPKKLLLLVLDLFMLVNGKILNVMDKENKHGLMEHVMKENGRITE